MVSASIRGKKKSEKSHEIRKTEKWVSWRPKRMLWTKAVETCKAYRFHSDGIKDGERTANTPIYDQTRIKSV